jgi:hypothetical protein
MKRLGVLALVFVCGCGSNRAIARNLLVALTLGSAALAVGAAVKSNRIEKDLKRDLDQGSLTGRQFADRDDQGTHWNRIGRAAAFGAGVFVIGLGIVWETGVASEIQNGPRQPIPDETRPIFPTGARTSP